MLIQTIGAALSKALLDLASAKVLAAVGAFATFTALGQYDEASLVALTFLGIGGVREVAKTITTGKTEVAVATSTSAASTVEETIPGNITIPDVGSEHDAPTDDAGPIIEE